MISYLFPSCLLDIVFWFSVVAADIDMMYSMCSFDKAWRPKDLSPWCAVFSQQDLEVYEFIDFILLLLFHFCTIDIRVPRGPRVLLRRWIWFYYKL